MSEHAFHANPRRRRRTAAERRAQHLRAEARQFARLLKGLTSIEQHRGNTLGPMGSCLLQTMQQQHQKQRQQHESMCRHFLAGRCQYGNRCKFSHRIGPHHGDEHDRDLGNPHYGVEHDLEQSDPHYGDEHDLEQSDPHYGDRDLGDSQYRDEHDIGDPHYGDESDIGPRYGEHDLGDPHDGDEHDLDHSDPHDGEEHDQDDHDSHKGEEQYSDDVEGIVGILRALNGQDQQKAFEALPMHLLHEVQGRLLQESKLADLLRQEAELDEKIFVTTQKAIDKHNHNKKLVRNIVGNDALRKWISRLYYRDGGNLMPKNRTTTETMHTRQTPANSAASSHTGPRHRL